MKKFFLPLICYSQPLFLLIELLFFFYFSFFFDELHNVTLNTDDSWLLTVIKGYYSV